MYVIFNKSLWDEASVFILINPFNTRIFLPETIKQKQTDPINVCKIKSEGICDNESKTVLLMVSSYYPSTPPTPGQDRHILWHIQLIILTEANSDI